MGRSKTYSAKVASQICEAIATGNKGVEALCTQNPRFPSARTFYRWLQDEANTELHSEYNLARERQADRLMHEIIEIADYTDFDTLLNEKTGTQTAHHEWISRSKLRVDARKWLAEKLAPKKYGDKADAGSGSEEKEVIKISLDLGN